VSAALLSIGSLLSGRRPAAPGCAALSIGSVL
jgi:hypothetical protein